MVTTTPLHVEPVDAANWRLLLDLSVTGSHGDSWTIPAGFITDFASVPRALTPYVPRYGIYTIAAIVHDYLCRIASGEIPSQRDWRGGSDAEFHALPKYVTRRDADGIFRAVLRDLETSFPRRWCMWSAVRGASGLSGATLVEALQVLVIALLVVPVVAVPVLLTVVLLALTWLTEALFEVLGFE